MEFTIRDSGPSTATGPIDWPATKAAIMAGLDVCAEYRALGVEFTRPGANKKGWRECRAIRHGGNRDDAPSGAVHVQTGVYKDSGDGGTVLGFFDFALKYGNFGRWVDVLKHYAEHAGVELGPVHAKSGGRIEEAHYDYRDPAGSVRYRVFRYRLPNGKKTFTQHPPDGKGGWKYGSGCMDGVMPLPYRLPELLASADAGDPIFVVEGEKDVEALAAVGLVATSSHGGCQNFANAWPRFDPEWYRGRDCFVIPDNDPGGRTFARQIAGWLAESGARLVKLVELPGLPIRGDVSDYLAAGGTVETLCDLAVRAPAFDPAAPVAAEADGDLSRDATVADLRRLVSAEGWLWRGWIPQAALTLIAAEPGTGKTRFCFDLHRRLVHHEPWPDGSPTPLLELPRVLWVVADNQHQEMCDIPTEFGIGDDLIVLNATAADPFDGTSLQTPEELSDFEARIARVRPTLVMIDTITNTGDFKSQDSADAKRQYKPLQEIAARQQVSILCVTHLNAGGKVLGRRALEKARVVIQMSCPDPDGQPNRRRLWVEKSKAIKPQALGVTMGDHGNEYDTHPPDPPSDRLGGATTGPVPTKARACMEWLRERLAAGPDRVKTIRDEAEDREISASVLYRAKDQLGIVEETVDGRKWWTLPAAAGGANGNGNGHGQPF